MLTRLLIVLLIALSLSEVFAQEVTEQPTAEAPATEPEVDPDLLREQAIATELPASEVKWLNSGDMQILARYKAEQTGKPQGGLLFVAAPDDTVLSSAIIKYGFDYFPGVSWHSMAIQPAKVSFGGPRFKPKENTSTESTSTETPDAESATTEAAPVKDITEPLLPDETTWYQEQHKSNQEQLVKRIQAAEAEIIKGENGYVLVSRGFSASLIIEAIVQGQIRPKGVILLDLNHPVPAIREAIVIQLAELQIPVMDIFSIHTRTSGEQRTALARKVNYQQKYLPVAGTSYRGYEPMVCRLMRNWLVRNFKP